MSGQRASVNEVSSDPGLDSQVHQYLVVVDGETTTSVQPLVCDLVADAWDEFVLGNPVILPEQTPRLMPDPEHAANRRGEILVFKVKEVSQCLPSPHQAIEIGYSKDRTLSHFMERYGVSTVGTDDQPPSGLRTTLNLSVDDVSLMGCEWIHSSLNTNLWMGGRR